MKLDLNGILGIKPEPEPKPTPEYGNLTREQILAQAAEELLDGLYDPRERMSVVETYIRLGELEKHNPAAFGHLEPVLAPIIEADPAALAEPLSQAIRRRQHA